MSKLFDHREFEWLYPYVTNTDDDTSAWSNIKPNHNDESPDVGESITDEIIVHYTKPARQTFIYAQDQYGLCFAHIYKVEIQKMDGTVVFSQSHKELYDTSFAAGLNIKQGQWSSGNKGREICGKVAIINPREDMVPSQELCDYKIIVSYTNFTHTQQQFNLAVVTINSIC